MEFIAFMLYKNVTRQIVANLTLPWNFILITYYWRRLQFSSVVDLRNSPASTVVSTISLSDKSHHVGTQFFYSSEKMFNYHIEEVSRRGVRWLDEGSSLGENYDNVIGVVSIIIVV